MSIFLLKNYLCVCVFGYMGLCAPDACSVHGGPKGATDPLELESQAVGSHHVGAGK